jgi:N-methylhydantoinase A
MPARLAADIGGTFTDIVLESGRHRFIAKVLTTTQAPEQGVLQGIDSVLAQAQLAPADIDQIIHGTTLATNALIERKGAKTALLTTAGFRDVVQTGYEKRFDQNRVFLDMPQPLVPRELRFTVSERISARGEILEPLDEAALQQLIALFEANHIEALAIGFLHAYAYAGHEQRAAALIRAALPGLSISLSSEVCPEMREYERFSTTCANAYVQPLMSGYLYRLEDHLQRRGLRCPLLLMSSSGGLTTVQQAAKFPIRLVESGPAGGAMLAAHIAAECALDQVLSFDMGGTTAKICLLQDGRAERARRFEVARIYRHKKGSGLPLRIPVIEMVEIGAGGGSIARVDTLQRISVGPDSAGSQPGPACYDRGGSNATVTDADLLLGKLDADDFAGGSIRLKPDRARAALSEHIAAATGLDGFWPAAAVNEIVDENMANAARVHAIERGRNIAAQTLIAFGGAAPLHAGRLAQKLGITRIIVPLAAGVGSAIGFLRAPVSYEVVRSFRTLLADLDPARINALLDAMRAQAATVVEPAAAGVALQDIRRVDMRYVGQGHEIPIALPSRPLRTEDLRDLQTAFETRYRQQYGLIIEDQALELITWSLTLTTPPTPPRPAAAPVETRQASSISTRPIYDPLREALIETPVYRRSELAVGAYLTGPALIGEAETATLVPAGFGLHVDVHGYLIIEKAQSHESA